MAGHTKVPFNDLFSQYEKECLEAAAEKAETEEAEDFTESKVKMGVFNVVKHFIRERTLSTGKRVDDREIKDIRPLYCEINNLPRVHGSGLFWR
jgi:polyribonucleotide nucleotidyltransferase